MGGGEWGGGEVEDSQFGIEVIILLCMHVCTRTHVSKSMYVSAQTCCTYK